MVTNGVLTCVLTGVLTCAAPEFSRVCWLTVRTARRRAMQRSAWVGRGTHMRTLGYSHGYSRGTIGYYMGVGIRGIRGVLQGRSSGHFGGLQGTQRGTRGVLNGVLEEYSTGCSRATRGLLEGYCRGTQGALWGTRLNSRRYFQYSRGISQVLTGHSTLTGIRVFVQGYSRGTPWGTQ